MEFTPRQCQIINLVVQGYSNKEIAKKLFITENTVKYHCKVLFAKFEVTSRTQLIFKFSIKKSA
ncbi:hypothetical protein CS022_18245 [Veronia nyctiphanis]|uniref:HTH luxR-type domain-containing protein n=1 Tax=Veronia nyctiphanis TaxID=1278244 RepID=A0A4Q0YMI3_9GAMM|nr:hypothetical protein CS022_17965 [Veronia nyctiphanis]RXJ72067.1 hypothetical protein CS022_18245 [Veronia nyctiphanis]